MLQIRTSHTKTRGAARQENTSPFKAIKYKDITLLSLRKPLSQDTGRPLFSPVQLLSWSQAQKLGGNRQKESSRTLTFWGFIFV